MLPRLNIEASFSLPRTFFLFPCYYRCNSTHITENTTQLDYSYYLETTKNKYQDTLTCPQRGLVLQEAVPPAAFSFLVAESCHFSHPEPHSSAPRSALQGQPLLFPSGHGAQPTTATKMMAMCGHGSWEQDCSLGSSPWLGQAESTANKDNANYNSPALIWNLWNDPPRAQACLGKLGPSQGGLGRY